MSHLSAAAAPRALSARPELERLLDREGLRCSADAGPAASKYEFYVSDAAEKFCSFANSILPYDIEQVRQINIEGYESEERAY